MWPRLLLLGVLATSVHTALSALSSASWEQSKDTELDWWKDWMMKHKDSHLLPRLDPHRKLDKGLIDVIKDHYQGQAPTLLRIMDMGAGPATTLGKVLPGHVLQVRACDADAYRYVAVWAMMGMQPLVATEHCTFENASSWIKDKFDVVFQQNALDHAHDVVKSIDSMLDLVAPGGLMVLWNMANEGERQKYWGMHQWNFKINGPNKHFVVQGPGPSGPMTDITRRVRQSGWKVHAEYQSGWCPYRQGECLQLVFSRKQPGARRWWG